MGGLLGIDTLIIYLLRAVVMLITIPFHEAAHALVSWLLGGPHGQKCRAAVPQSGTAF